MARIAGRGWDGRGTAVAVAVAATRVKGGGVWGGDGLGAAEERLGHGGSTRAALGRISD